MLYGELHAHSGFSFLDGASDPEELAAEGARLGLSGLALTDHHGFYGIVRFAEAARAFGLPTVFGTEISIDADDDRVGVHDPSARIWCCSRARPRDTARSRRCSARPTCAAARKARRASPSKRSRAARASGSC